MLNGQNPSFQIMSPKVPKKLLLSTNRCFPVPFFPISTRQFRYGVVWFTPIVMSWWSSSS